MKALIAVALVAAAIPASGANLLAEGAQYITVAKSLGWLPEWVDINDRISVIDTTHGAERGLVFCIEEAATSKRAVAYGRRSTVEAVLSGKNPARAWLHVNNDPATAADWKACGWEPPAPPQASELKDVRKVGFNSAGVNSWRVPSSLLVPGACFYVTAVDTAGNESAPSNVVCPKGVAP